MVSSPEPPRTSRGRPRKEGAEARILEAALEEYAERGWSGFTMDGVARRAGVGKSTVYLRWRDKDSLLTEAVGRHSSVVEQVDTGALASDLAALGRNIFRYLLDPGGWATIRVTVEAAASPAPLGRFCEAVSQQHYESAEAIVARAVDRGEASDDIPATVLVECLYGAILIQTLGLAGDDRKLGDDDITRRVDPIVGFVMAGAGL
ncbi:MAG: TetR/AcrR family transcriptional regulator [Nocardioides sp.]